MKEVKDKNKSVVCFSNLGRCFVISRSRFSKSKTSRAAEPDI